MNLDLAERSASVPERGRSTAWVFPILRTVVIFESEGLMTELYFYLRGLAKREEGQTMAEYAVVLAVITVAIVAALTALSGNISDALGAVGDRLNP
jgi:Flp pilus assembly pilin Flp